MGIIGAIKKEYFIKKDLASVKKEFNQRLKNDTILKGNIIGKSRFRLQSKNEFIFLRSIEKHEYYLKGTFKQVKEHTKIECKVRSNSFFDIFTIFGLGIIILVIALNFYTKQDANVIHKQNLPSGIIYLVSGILVIAILIINQSGRQYRKTALQEMDRLIASIQKQSTGQ